MKQYFLIAAFMVTGVLTGAGNCLAAIIWNSTSPLPTGYVGTPYSYQLSVSGGVLPITYSIVSGNLLGLSLSSSGLISGTPKTPGTVSVTIRARDSTIVAAPQVADRTFIFTVASAASLITDLSQPSVFQTAVSPSAIRLSRDIAVSQTITYSFSNSKPVTQTLTLSPGLFKVGGRIIGQVSTTLTAAIYNGKGSVSEVLLVPISVFKAAEALRSTEVSYERTFTDSATTYTLRLPISFTSGITADLRITRMQLYFDNQRSEITVDKSDRPPKIFARLDFIGSGLIQGYWEVDGRMYARLSQNLVYGTSIVLEPPALPPLPTFETGSHRVRLVITTPVQDIPLPQAIYYVTASRDKAYLPIGLVSPKEQGVIDKESATFIWQAQKKATAYLVEFFDNEAGRPVFSAYTRKARYTVADHILSRIFAEKGSYFWKVTGFSEENIVINESRIQGFRLQHKALGHDTEQPEVR